MDGIPQKEAPASTPRKVVRALRAGGPRLVVAKTLLQRSARLRRAARPMLLRSAGREIARKRCLDPDKAVDFAFDYWLGDVSIAPGQVRSEIRQLLALLAQDPPRTLLEIGTDRGGTSFLFLRVAAPDAVLVTVDLPDAGAAFLRPLLRRFPAEGQRLEFVAGDSHEPATLEHVKDALDGREVDVLLIDGDHSEPGVRSDFSMYFPLVRRGGIVALHDIVPGGLQYVGNVPEFWQEIKTPDALEYVESWEQRGFGIGVLRKR